MVELVGIESNIVKIAQLIFRTSDHPNPPEGLILSKNVPLEPCMGASGYSLIKFHYYVY